MDTHLCVHVWMKIRTNTRSQITFQASLEGQRTNGKQKRQLSHSLNIIVHYHDIHIQRDMYVYVCVHMSTYLCTCIHLSPFVYIYIFVLFWYLGFCVLHTTPYHIVITNYPYNRYEYLEILIWYLYRARASIWEYLGRDLEHVPYDLGSMSHLLFKFAVSPGPTLCGWAGGVPRVA